MDFENICRFVPVRKGQALHILNLVYETKEQIYTGLKAGATYKLHLVCTGEGTLHTPGHTVPLRPGDLFFTQPAVPSAIESGEGLTYLYISFLGDRANLFIDQLRINGENCHFPGFEYLDPLFRKALDASIEVADIYCESILLYAFAALGNDLFPTPQKEKDKPETMALIKKYIDDHFSDPNLSLETIGEALNYNKKYISTVFKAKFKIGVADYLRMVRIQHACTLMEQGFTSVKDISALCGFSDPLYFSKVFRSRMGISPRQHITQLNNQ